MLETAIRSGRWSVHSGPVAARPEDRRRRRARQRLADDHALVQDALQVLPDLTKAPQRAVAQAGGAAAGRNCRWPPVVTETVHVDTSRRWCVGGNTYRRLRVPVRSCTTRPSTFWSTLSCVRRRVPGQRHCPLSRVHAQAHPEKSSFCGYRKFQVRRITCSWWTAATGIQVTPTYSVSTDASHDYVYGVQR